MDAILFGFAVVFVVGFLRALPWPEAWKRRKPLSCNACMTGWCLIMAGLVGGFTPGLLAAGGVAYVLLSWQSSWGEAMGPPES